MAFATDVSLGMMVCALVMCQVHGKAVPTTVAPSSSVYHTADEVPVVADIDLCSMTGHTYAQVYELKGLACQARDDYNNNSTFLKSGFFDWIYPGPNSVPICNFSDKALWRDELGYVAGVMHNLRKAGYISTMLKYERIVNSSAANTFLYVMEEMVNKTRKVNRMLAQLTAAVPNVTLVDLVGQPDKCSTAPEDDGDDFQAWPPAEADMENVGEYHYFLAVYNYGTMDAMCETLRQLHDSLQLTLNGTCVRPEEQAHAVTLQPTGKQQ